MPRTVPWRRSGLLMALTFSALQMLNEIGTMVAIPLYGSMSQELTLSPAQTTWALMSTTIFGAATIALLAKAGDRYGHRRLMIYSVAGIIAGFVISALAPNFLVLLIGRALTGMMAGQALCIGIMNDRLTGTDKRKAIAIIAGGQAIGVFCGFFLGGIIVEAGGTFRHAFWLGAALTLVSLLAFLAWGSDSDALERHAAGRPRIEVAGVVLLGIGLTLLCVGISQSTAWGLGDWRTLACILGGLAVIALSLLVEARATHPLLDVRELAGRNLTPAYAAFLTLGVCGMLLFNAAMALLQIPGTLPLPTGPLQIGPGFGYTALQASFVFLPMTAAGLVAAKVIPGLLRRTSARTGLVLGGLLMAVAFAILRVDHAHVATMLAAILIYGFGYTTVLSTAVSVIAVEAKEGKGAGTASLYVSMALAASSLGAAIFAALQNSYTGPALLPDGSPIPGLPPLPQAALFDHAFVIAAVAALVAVVAGLVLKPTRN
ncbi:MFS transporter [Actinoplanes sp. NBC_00393]|uniref:MFS transporter n=1 Tax=Actinoplanes sp. NBC_00393 TaxID=2975953 RepID=UPI002E1B4AAF